MFRFSLWLGDAARLRPAGGWGHRCHRSPQITTNMPRRRNALSVQIHLICVPIAVARGPASRLPAADAGLTPALCSATCR
jgi:hypothetical protein